jgi:mannose/cellobiose epimerase-like protein (N-acyl-D-glucosamine 2-epimerase family)
VLLRGTTAISPIALHSAMTATAHATPSPLPLQPQPAFDSERFLRQHVNDTLNFYAPRARDPEGGYFHYFLDDGTVYNAGHRHLVSATRFVFNGCQAYSSTGDVAYRDWAAHALAHLARFRRADGLYAWTLQDGQIEDATVMAYGQAFILLAFSHAHRVGLASADEVAAAFDRMDTAFYDSAARAYADEITPEGELIAYRGQNANMHTCEACLAAFEATGEQRYLDRALSLIERFAFELADQTLGLVWEHYRTDWTPDWDYNRDNPGNIFKPWGFQTGHQTEWAKLLLIAHTHAPSQRLVERAVHLQSTAWQHGWDATHGGLIYGFAPDFTPCDVDKYHWVQAESFAAAWRLWRVTGREEFRQQYLQLWAWSWQHLVDHTYGAWFRIVGNDGRKLENTKSPAGKADYHTMGACWDVMSVGGLQA